MNVNVSLFINFVLCVVFSLNARVASALTVSDIPLNQATLISSNDDYGLELDWVRQMNTVSYFDGSNCSITSIKTDKEGNIYLYGRFSNSIVFDDTHSKIIKGYSSSYFAKISKDNELLWLKYLSPTVKKEVQFNDFEILEDGSLLVVLHTDTSSLGYDDKMFFEYKGDCYKANFANVYQYVFLKINPVTGDLERSMVTKGGFDIDNDNTMIVCTPDGGFVLNTSMPEDFEGLNKENPTLWRPLGRFNKYIAKFDSNFKMVWDFAISDDSEFKNFEPNGSEENFLFLKGDTLLVSAHYCKDFQISPDIDNPSYVKFKGNYYDSKDGFPDLIFLRYLIKDDKPKLIDYASYKCTEAPRVYGFSMDKDGDIYFPVWKPSKGHYLYRLNNDLSFEMIDSSPYSSNGIFSYSLLHNSDRNLGNYDDEGCFNFTFKSFEDSVIYFNDTCYVRLDNTNEIVSRGYVRYDKEKRLRYAFLVCGKRAPWPGGTYHRNISNGFLVFPINQFSAGDEVNFSLNEEEPVIKMGGDKGISGLVKYTETFRIREEASGNGHILQAGEMVRHGSDVSITAQPEEGYRVDSILTDKGERLALQADGTFLLPNVTDAVTLRAFYSQTDGVADHLTDGFSVYPNPATDVITVSGLGSFDFFISDLSGRTLSSGRAEGGSVSVSALPVGSYILKINKDKAIKFEKK